MRSTSRGSMYIAILLIGMGALLLAYTQHFNPGEEEIQNGNCKPKIKHSLFYIQKP